MEPEINGKHSSTPVRVVLLGDSRLFCEGLRHVCAADPGVKVVAEASMAGVHELIRTVSPQVIISDVRVNGVLDLCRELRQKRGGQPCLLLVGAEVDDDWTLRALQAGARGILPKSASAQDLLKAVRVVQDGQIWANKRVMARIVDQLATIAEPPAVTEAALAQRLSRRQQQIVHYAVFGLSNQEIAQELSISEATVKAHLTHIFQKLGVRDRVQLVTRYHRTVNWPQAVAAEH